MTKMNSKAIGLLSETASDLAYFALPVKVATDLITIKGFVEADKVLNDETLLNMMAEAGWIIESKNDAGEKIYFADPRKKLTEKGHAASFSDAEFERIRIHVENHSVYESAKILRDKYLKERKESVDEEIAKVEAYLTELKKEYNYKGEN